MSKIREGEVGG